MLHLRPRLEALTGLRFFAAMAVVLVHLHKEQLIALPPWGQSVAANGWVAVSLFFVLSGFILTYSYLDEQGNMVSTRRGFWVARFARIYPVYLIGLLLSLPHFLHAAFQTTPVGPAVLRSAVDMAAGLTLTQSWWVPSMYAVNSPAWSLSCEAFFYALFPFVASWIVRLDRRRLVSGVAVVYVLYLAPTVIFGLLRLPWDPWASVIYGNPLLRLPEFLIGLGLGALFLKEGRAGRVLPSPGALALGATISVLATMAALDGLMATVPNRGPFLQYSLLTPLFAILVYSLAFGSGSIAWFLSRPGTILLGEASYGVYILQAPLLAWTKSIAAGWPAGGIDPGTLAVFYVVVLIALSVLSFLFLERPARRFLRRALAGASGQERPEPGIGRLSLVDGQVTISGAEVRGTGVEPVPSGLVDTSS